MWFFCFTKTFFFKFVSVFTVVNESSNLYFYFYFDFIFFTNTATEGWDAWSSWSLCDADGMQMRRRRCLVGDLGLGTAPGLCQGRSQEERVCITNLEGAYHYAHMCARARHRVFT